MEIKVRYLGRPFNEEEMAMAVQDLELSRDILYLFADEESYPSKLQYLDLVEEFPNIPDWQVLLSIDRLSSAGLLQVKLEFHRENITMCEFIGLTNEGDAFVFGARNPKRWEKSLKKCAEMFGVATVSQFSEVLIKTTLSI